MDDELSRCQAPGQLATTFARLRLAVLALLVVGAFVTFLVVGTDGARDLLTDVGESNWGVVAFIAVYAVAVVVLLPGTIGTLAAGAVFGFPLGAVAALGGATLGATLSFLVSRAMGRHGARSLFGDRLESVDEFIGRNDFTSVLVLRLMPIVPFNLLNYGAGLTSARLSRYVAASAIGMAPATMLATGLGDQADDPTGTAFLLLLGAFLALLVVSGFYARRVRSKRGD